MEKFKQLLKKESAVFSVDDNAVGEADSNYIKILSTSSANK